MESRKFKIKMELEFELKFEFKTNPNKNIGARIESRGGRWGGNCLAEKEEDRRRRWGGGIAESWEGEEPRASSWLDVNTPMLTADGSVLLRTGKRPCETTWERDTNVGELKTKKRKNDEEEGDKTYGW